MASATPTKSQPKAAILAIMPVQSVAAAVWARRPIARLRQAARHRSLFHLWFHPYNVTASPDRAFDALERICREADRLRDADRLDVLTMGDVAGHLDARADVAAR